jgi:hypothetical protein
MMEAKIIDFAEWKASHPPALIFWNYGLTAMVAWHKLWIKLVFG